MDSTCTALTNIDPALLDEKLIGTSELDECSVQLRSAIQEIHTRLATAKKLFADRWSLVPDAERTITAETLRNTEDYLQTIQAQVRSVPEALRLGRHFGGVFAVGQPSWLDVFLARLSIANDQLNTAIILLCQHQRGFEKPQGSEKIISPPFLPPSYAESQFLNASRQRNLSRRSRLLRTSFDAQSREAIAELAGENEVVEKPASLQVETSNFLCEMDAGYIPYRQGRRSQSMTNLSASLLQKPPEGPRQPVASRESALGFDVAEVSILSKGFGEAGCVLRPLQRQKAIIGRARSRRWLQDQASRSRDYADLNKPKYARQCTGDDDR